MAEFCLDSSERELFDLAHFPHSASSRQPSVRARSRVTLWITLAKLDARGWRHHLSSGIVACHGMLRARRAMLWEPAEKCCRCHAAKR
jgi:hypothetical protein